MWRKALELLVARVMAARHLQIGYPWNSSRECLHEFTNWITTGRYARWKRDVFFYSLLKHPEQYHGITRNLILWQIFFLVMKAKIHRDSCRGRCEEGVLEDGRSVVVLESPLASRAWPESTWWAKGHYSVVRPFFVDKPLSTNLPESSGTSAFRLVIPAKDAMEIECHLLGDTNDF